MSAPSIRRVRARLRNNFAQLLLATLNATRKAGLSGALSFLLLSSSPIFAQSNGTYSASGSSNWSTAGSWLGGTIPDSNGVATFDNFRGQLTNATVTVDTTSRTLSQINFNQSFSMGIAASGGASIVMGSSGLTLNSIASLTSSPASFYNGVNAISAPITGTGDLIKIGTGNVALSGTNTFTGTIRLNEGALWLSASSAAAQNTALGNLANAIEFNGGTLGVTGQTFTTSRSIIVNAGGATTRNFANSTWNGTLTGGGLLNNQLGTLTLGGNVSGFTGGIRVDNSTVTLSGTSALGGSSSIVVGGSLNVSNATTNVSNRLNGRGIASFGGNVSYTGNASAASTESAGNLTLSSGTTTISVTPGTNQSATLTFSGLTREDRSIAYFRGTSLGSAPAANVANVRFTNSPGTLIGGGGTTATNASILPFAIGSATGAVTSGTTISFVTWDGTTQRIVPLNTTTGYATNLGNAASDDNVSLGANASVNIGGQTVNSLRFGGAFTLAGGASDVLTVTSGAVLSTTNTAVINAPLNFGANEGVVFSSGALTINGPISGTNGITKAGVGSLTLGANNTYTGTTTLTHGNTTVAGGVVTADGSAPSVFGQDTSAIRMHSSSNTVGVPTRLWTTGNLVVNRNFDVKLGGAQVTGIGTAGNSANESLTFNGNVSLNAYSPDILSRYVTIEGGDNIAESVTFNGDVSGNGGLRAAFGSYTVLAGNNSYSGGTLIGLSSLTNGATNNTLQVTTETWDARSSTAFGTGTIFIHGSANTTQPVLTTGLILSSGNGTNTFANDVMLTNGFARFGGTQALNLNGNITLNSGATNNSVISVESLAAPVTINGNIAAGGLIKHGVGTLVLTGSKTYSGQTIVREGTLSVSSIGNGGTAGNLGQAPAASNYLVLSGNAVGNTGILNYTGNGETTDRLLTLQGTGGTISANGTGALIFGNTTGTIGMGAGTQTINGVTLVANAGVIALSTTAASQIVVGSTVTGSGTGIPANTTVTEVGANYVRLSTTGTNALGAQNLTFTLPSVAATRTLTLTGSNTGLNTIAPVLADGANVGLGVVKEGSGTWVLSGNNTYTGGTTVNNGLLGIGSNTALGTGAVQVNNGAMLRAEGADRTLGNAVVFNGNSGIVGSNALTLSGTVGLGAATRTIAVDNAVTTMGGVISGGAGAGIIKEGSGALNLTAANTFTGTTMINTGMLLVNNTTGNAVASTMVNSGGFLGGAGSVGGNLTVNAGGTVNPGNSPGILMINGNATFSAGSNFVVELDGPTAGAFYDQLAVSGTIDLGGANLVLDLGYDPTTSDFFYILSNTGVGAISGTFAGLSQGGLFNTNFNGIDYVGTISYTGDFNSTNFVGAGNDVVLFNITAVPEPSTIVLIAAAGSAGWLIRRRRKK